MKNETVKCLMLLALSGCIGSAHASFCENFTLKALAIMEGRQKKIPPSMLIEAAGGDIYATILVNTAYKQPIAKDKEKQIKDFGLDWYNLVPASNKVAGHLSSGSVLFLNLFMAIN